MLRRVTVNEARRSVAAWPRASAARRASRPTARTRASGAARRRRWRASDGFGTANSRMLSSLAGTAGPSRECRGRVLSLSGMTGSLGVLGAHDAAQLGRDRGTSCSRASRAIRATAREALELARAPGWGSTCRALPPAPAREPPLTA